MSAGPADGVARLQRIFEKALELPEDERVRFLDETCAGDAALRGRVDAMLAADAQPRLLFDSSARESTFASGADDAPSRLGPFEILSKIGEGGMGIVYEARQETPRRVVALKVIRPGLASPEVLRRFHHESEVLAQLQHPGIAQVHAAGSVDGRPWFAMERIHGLPLDVWVARRKPDVRQRLLLLASICDAVHHAHEKGIVHRDLKPANVLVDDADQPKVLDFGVARAMGGSDLTATMHTSTGQIVGTLAYMSPEQVGATGSRVDRRSDVYALGVMLYELLAARLPYLLHGQPMVEALRIIRDEEPSRLSSVSHRFRGDLETIASKALAKDPDRRYASAAELAADIRRYLSDEPIVARPPSTWYQVVKFARRNRALVSGVAAALVVFVLGTVVASIFAIRAAKQRSLFEHEAYRSAIAAASAEIRLNDGGRAAAILDGTSEALRGWEWRYLRRAADRSLRTIHVGQRCPGVVLSRDGRRAAAITTTGTLAAWDLDSGERMLLLEGYNSETTTLAFAADARQLYVSDRAASRTRALALDGGAVEWELPYAGIGPLSFAPDGSIVFGAAGQAIAVDPLSGHERRRWSIGVAASDIAYLPDGRHVAYMTGSGMQLATLPSWTPVFSASKRTYLSGTGHRLIGVPPGGAAELRDMSGQLVLRSPVSLADVHPLDPELGVTTIPEHGVGLVDVASGRPEVTLLGHSAEVLWGWFAADGTRLLTHARDLTLRVWDTATPPDPWITTGCSGCFYAVSPEARFSAEAGWGYVRVWDARSGWPVWTRMVSRRGLSSLAFDATGKRIVAVGEDGPVFVLDVERGGEHRELARLPVGALSVAWSPDGKQILVAGVDGVTRILDAGDGRQLRTLGDERASAHVVLLLPDGSTVATGGRGPDAPPVRWATGNLLTGGSGGVRLWDRATGRLLRTLDGSGATVRVLAARLHELAAGYDDGAISVWDLRSGRRIDAPATAAPIDGLTFDPDGKRLLVGRLGTIEILEADSLRLLTTLAAPALDLQAAAFATDGTLVAAGRNVALAVFETEAATDFYRRRSLARRLERRHDLWRRSQIDPDLMAALAAAPELDASERSEALVYARALGTNPNVLNSEALATVRLADAARADYELAFRRIRAALPFRPDDLSFLKTLELAQLRLRDHSAALATAERAESLLLAQAQSPRAVDLAVRTMAEQALGQRQRARLTLERLRTVMGAPAEVNDIESRAFLVEAEKAVVSSGKKE